MSDNELDEILNEVKNRSGDASSDNTLNKNDSDVSSDSGDTVDLRNENSLGDTADIPKIEDDDSTDNGTESLFSEDSSEDSAESNESSDISSDGGSRENEGAIDILSVADAEPEDAPADRQCSGKKKNKSKTAIIIIIILIIAALAVGGYLYAKGYFGKKDNNSSNSTPSTTQAIILDKSLANPLTGVYDYNKNAIGKRPVAVVVENEYSTEAVRPQWGLADADMIMEGETEFSTRLLLFWADMNQVPAQVGPTRSARPPFINFSQMWNAIFIHAGLSHSKGDYEGADTVFKNGNIDHINLLSYEENGTYFGRDNTRKTAIEHTGYLNGKNTVNLIQKNKFDTQLNENKFTQFEFNDNDEPAGEDPAVKVTFKWSDRCPKKGVFTYNESKGVYTTEDFDSKYGKSNLEVKTLIYLLDDTEYIVKENYKGSGNSETYCNYGLDGGKGKIVSMGRSQDITWSKEDGKLVLKTSDGKDVKLNRGKIYIGYGSSNHGGSIEVE